MGINIILLIVGFVLLIKGASWLVDGAASVAKKLGISSLVIGLTIVAFGTSAPELVVNIFAAIRGSSELAIGNIFGSNISNIFLVLGVSAMVYPLSAKHGTIWKEIPLGILAVILVGVMANDTIIENRMFAELSRIDGFVLISFFIIFVYYVFGVSKVKPADQFSMKLTSYTTAKSTLMILGGVIGLALGGKWIIDGATSIALGLNISESIIGLTIVALGTSLPELATSAMAAYKKDVDIAIGNVVGSNIFNLFWVLGVTALIHPLTFSSELLFDGFVAAFASVALFVVMLAGKKRRTLERWEGVVFVLLYVFYVMTVAARALA
jgi:cation:H+ antiporter